MGTAREQGQEKGFADPLKVRCWRNSFHCFVIESETRVSVVW